MESEWNLWVWLECIGVASGWNLWVWLECIGVVVRKDIDSLIILLIPTSLVLAFFCSSSVFTSFFILKMFFVFVYVNFVQRSKHCSKNIRERSKIEIMRTWRYN